MIFHDFGRWVHLQVGYWVQYKLISVEVEMRTIEISSPSFRIHRGRLDNVMKIYISKLLPKFLSKNIFKNFEKKIGKYFHFPDFGNLKNRKISKCILHFRWFSAKSCYFRLLGKFHSLWVKICWSWNSNNRNIVTGQAEFIAGDWITWWRFKFRLYAKIYIYF